jgi:hypothetical protein
MNEQIEQLQSLLDDHQLYHSEFQMDNFITAKSGGGTVYGQYKQALRELFKRYRGIKELETSKALLQVDIDELASQKSWFNVFSRRRNAINLVQKRMCMEDLEKNISDTKREFDHFYRQALKMKLMIGPLSPTLRNRLDTEMWIHNLKCMVAVDYLCHGRMSAGTLTSIMALPVSLRLPLLTEVKTEKDKLVLWYENQEPMQLLKES